MSRKQYGNDQNIPPELLKNKMQQANVSQQVKAMAQQREEQNQQAIRMFVADTAKRLYVDRLSGDVIDSDEEELKGVAHDSQQKALILAEQLGFIKLQRNDDSEDGGE